jgi:hypothetical protein
MTDQDDRSGIVTVIADSLIRDQPANGEFVDVSSDAGFFETLGQAVHSARKDRPERAAEQVDARLRLGRGWRCDGGGGLQTAEKMQTERTARITTAATCVGLLMRFPSVILL